VSFSEKNKRSFKFLFDLAQKGEDNKEVILKKLVSLFGVGTVSKHFHEDNWSFRVNGLSNSKVIMDYFDKFNYTFLTKKYNSYLLWKIIHKQIQNLEHLDPINRQKLINLSKTVNNY